MTATIGDDDLMPVLDLSYEPTYRREPGGAHEAFGSVAAAIRAASWPGVVLPAASVLGATVFPVVELTGARNRVADGVGPQRSLTVLALWEACAADPATKSSAPPAPLRIVGFASAAPRWDRAMRSMHDIAGLGAGLIVRARKPSTWQLLDADAEDVWVVAGSAGDATLAVRGRTGPLGTACRVPATRLIEEGLFAHALACGAVNTR